MGTAPQSFCGIPLRLLMQQLHKVASYSRYPHYSNPNPANAAALLKHEDAATSAAGALDTDSKGTDATAE
jgi:hypothetical protein